VGLAKWGISGVWRTLSYDKIGDVTESMDASICREERRNRKRGRGKKMEDRGAGKRMLTDCRAISDPPPTHRASIRLDIPLCRTHLINTQTML